MIENMIYSKNGLSLTENFEGCKFIAYQDVRGIWTCGYGHTAGVTKDTTCTQELAEEWLQQDIAWAVGTVSNLVKVELTQGEFDALVDFVFNAGSGNFKNSTMLRLLNSGDYKGAAAEFECWDRAGGVEVAGLLRRRISEEVEFNQGEEI
jgi:lysozyme